MGSSAGGTANGGGSSTGGSDGAAQAEPPETATSARTPATVLSAGPPPGAPEVDRIHYVELELEDADGNPLSGATYEIAAPDGSVHKGTLGITGKVRVDRLPEGACEVTFPSMGKNPRSRG
jgi:hypothetical protein